MLALSKGQAVTLEINIFSHGAAKRVFHPHCKKKRVN
jgi:hypothetical protein